MAAMTPAEKVLTETVGRVIEFWGFSRNMGRLWAALYLSPEPLPAKDLRARLAMSTGAVSMALTELLRWGVVRKVWVPGDRKGHFAAETNVWKMISRVISERERVEVAAAIEGFEQALQLLADERRRAGDAETKKRVAEQSARVQQLLEFAKLGRSLMDAFLATSRIDAGPLTRFVLRGRCRVREAGSGGSRRRLWPCRSPSTPPTAIRSTATRSASTCSAGP